MSENEKPSEPQTNGASSSTEPPPTNESKENTPNGNTNGEESKDSNDKTPNGDSEKESKHQNRTAAKARDKAEKAKKKLTETQRKAHDKANPPGGYDATPIPSASSGHTVRITFHRADNLPVADLKAQSSDPYLTATLTPQGIRTRHKDDPVLALRTKTIHKSTDPVWNQEWIVAGIPTGGFRLKCRLYDEDPADHDDRLGNVTIYVGSLGAGFHPMKEEGFEIKKRMGSKRAYLIRGCVAMLSSIKMNGTLFISIEVLGESDKPYGRVYTVGPCAWTKHTSPMIGRLTGTKAPADEDNSENKKKTQKYNFQATQFQLQGPVPAELYHRFVEFKPFVKGMFSKAGLRGRILNKALHHQHAHIYNYSPTTEYGIVEPHSEAASQKFLQLVHYDEGGRIFTYVLTLDGLLRFTETGKEFGIDLLSKHTMHSDVNMYIACSGEFFIRRLANPNKSAESPDQRTHPDEDIPGGPPNEPPPKNPKDYELVIDNDSGTYRPKGSLLPLLQKYLSENFPGLQIVTKECTDDKLTEMKKKQREIKKKQGQNMILVQNSDDEVSSSDEDELDRRASAKGKKSKRTRAYEALEDPKGTVGELVHGMGGKGHAKSGSQDGSQAEEAKETKEAASAS